MSSDLELPVVAPSVSNLTFVEKLYYDYLNDPSTVGEAWQRYFQALPPANGLGLARAPERFPRRRVTTREAAGPDAAFQAKVDKLVLAYREFGHLRARLDPLGLVRAAEPLALEAFDLSERDLERPVADPDGSGGSRTLRDLVARLEDTYCRTIGVELAHIHDPELRGWLQGRMERTGNHVTLAPEVKRKLLDKIVQAELLESYLGTKFLGAKRFSVEGAEGLLPLLDLLVDRATGHGVRNVVFGMAHRGRLNVLANVIGKPLDAIMAEFRDQGIMGAGTGDVKYHLGHSADRETPDGVLVHLSLSFNPSHLEWINTVVQGRVRAKADRYHDFERARTLPVLIHGDAAFAGQGIVAEALNMSQLDAYHVGGTVHVVVNNQVGFTTSPRDARSTTYPTGPARMLQIPVFHVNGEDVEAVAQTVLLALDFRQRFHRDVVIDLWTYRRHGHNEGDEPAFTQPVMYRAIATKPSLRHVYGEELERAGVVTKDDVAGMERAYRERLEAAYHASVKRVDAGSQEPTGFWKGLRSGPVGTTPPPETGAPRERLQEVAAGLVNVPPGFHLHPKLAKVLEGRAAMGRGERGVDWATAELLALGSLALEGVRVRLVGQDSRRGTFSQRHAVYYDSETGMPYAPLSHLREGQGPVEIRDSLLSEAAALAFEYGYSLEMPDALTLWEAQFGDFVNAAQVVVDQFLSSAEAKWRRLSGLVLLLPHGMEGQGPEHSSARLERFLELSVEDNWRVLNPTTPAGYFHALRRQIRSQFRKPLVVMAPKSLLRHPAAVSPLEDFTQGRFRPILPDPRAADPREITRVVLVSGKLFYDLAAAREAQGARHVAIVRLEQLYPLRADMLLAELGKYPAKAEIVWAQEEPSNMGAWDFIDREVSRLVAPRPIELVSRPPSASPAAGSATRHKLEQEQLLREALGEAPSMLHRQSGRTVA